MEEFVIAVAAPITAVDRVGSEQVERASDIIGAAARQHEHDLLGHSLADHRKEAAVEVGGAPFAVGGRKIEFKERVPVSRLEVGTGQHLDVEPSDEGLAPL